MKRKTRIFVSQLVIIILILSIIYVCDAIKDLEKLNQKGSILSISLVYVIWPSFS